MGAQGFPEGNRCGEGPQFGGKINPGVTEFGSFVPYRRDFGHPFGQGAPILGGHTMGGNPWKDPHIYR